MTAHPIDTEALRRLADQATPGPWPLFSGGEYVGGVGILVAPDDGGVSPANAAFIAAARTAVPALLDALATAEHRATRAEAQSAIRGRAVVMYRDRAREAEAERDEWRQTALDERAAALDALEQIKVRDARVAEEKHLRMKATAAATQAEARVRAVQDVLDAWALREADVGAARVLTDIRRALEA